MTDKNFPTEKTSVSEHAKIIPLYYIVKLLMREFDLTADEQENLQEITIAGKAYNVSDEIHISLRTLKTEGEKISSLDLNQKLTPAVPVKQSPISMRPPQGQPRGRTR